MNTVSKLVILTFFVGSRWIIASDICYQDAFENDPTRTSIPESLISENSLGWMCAGPVACDALVAREGTHSIRLGCQPSYNYINSAPLPVECGEILTCSVWVKTRDAVGNNCAIVRFHHDTGAQQSGWTDMVAQAPNGTNDWTKITARARVPFRARAVIVFLMTRENTTGTVWFDDFVFTRISATAALSESYADVPLLPEPSHEELVKIRAEDHPMIDLPGQPN